MAERKILVDSNVYFRLAKSIHPLLGRTFGRESYCLYVIKQLQTEYDNNPRLRNVFPWVNEASYVNNRSHRLPVTRDENIQIQRAFEFIHDYVRNVHPGVSRVDVLCLAHAEVLGIPVVTDDADMIEAARDYEIKVCKTLDLLKLMLDSGYIEIAKIKEIAGYWRYLNDCPKDFVNDYRKLFGENPPR